MKHHSILPYYHPTTVIMVDDNQRFLENFSLILSEQLAFRFMASANEALSFINDRKQTIPLDQRCFSYMEGKSSMGGAIRLDIALMEQEISNPERFRDISVVVVDYDMPEMTGLEFCRRISNPRIKKILLTGVGDEKVAVDAFNDGLIDRFMKKNDPDIEKNINDAIASLQRRYFHQVSSFIQNTLAMKSPEFLYDPQVTELFFKIISEKKIAEYYYVEDPSGFLMVAGNGDLYRLLVMNDADIQTRMFEWRKLGAPDTILSLMGRHQALPWLWSSPDDTDETDPFDWQEHLYTARRVPNSTHWHYALVENPPADIEYEPESSSYASYLAEIDSLSLL